MTQEEAHKHMLHVRGVNDACTKCKGYGVALYGSGATWRGGMGTASFARDVCDVCWGSGDASKPWTNLRTLRDEKAAWERDQCVRYFAERTGVGYSSVKKGMLEVSKILDLYARKRNTPEGLDAFWWRDTLRLLAAAFKHFGEGQDVDKCPL